MFPPFLIVYKASFIPLAVLTDCEILLESLQVVDSAIKQHPGEIVLMTCTDETTEEINTYLQRFKLGLAIQQKIKQHPCFLVRAIVEEWDLQRLIQEVY